MLKNKQQLKRSTHGGLKHYQIVEFFFPTLSIVVAPMAIFFTRF
jgi:hypothetical protein